MPFAIPYHLQRNLTLTMTFLFRFDICKHSRRTMSGQLPCTNIFNLHILEDQYKKISF